ncbi:hypothetical protein [Sphingobium nicotianae]|uniref:Uncharacterized protein n=1 Tax=Sphingobium nicotianae TaxID=2782607 RepID=A0A9X1AJD2_9SPHN|nr:hypothetical protein [Sphingobium nicotianae]MBT2185544.1 hypothetical protein [Sphingobium nicotianae]
MTDLLVSECAVTRAIASAANWHDSEKAKSLTSAIIGAHLLSCSLPHEVRRHLGYLEGRAVRVGLAHGWDWALTPHGDGLVSAWEELKTVRGDAIEIAMREAGCAPYSWHINSELFFQLGDAAPSVEQVVGVALAARDALIEREAA